MEMQADIRILSKVILKDKKIEDPEAFFMEQLNAKDYTKKEWNVMKYMAQCLEESGLLLVSTKEISHKLGIEEKDCERLLDHPQAIRTSRCICRKCIGMSPSSA